ncbi:MAG: metal-dependent transcriptional regulator [Lachnospiraceae bacterium]|jgi:DtxR family Mn-dependent transcriptional regulator
MAYPHNYNESEEDYLETILILSGRLPVVRSVDIANEKGFKKSSISIAMKKLREKSLITVTDAGFIYLTESGRREAEATYERHRTLRRWLEMIGVDEETADADACKMEHVISEESFQAIRNYMVQEKHAARDKKADGREDSPKN